MMRNDRDPVTTIVVDLDGTLALIDHRRHYVEGQEKDWAAFYAACVHDEPNKPVIEIVNMFYGGYDIVIVSGRSDEVYAETKEWLRRHEVFYDMLIMREDGDYTPDHELKRYWFDRYLAERDIRFVLDDRDKVVQMWRSLGLTCLQVAPGNF